MIVCKSPAELERMRAANALVADVLAELAGIVAPGVTTKDLDEAAEKLVRDGGAEPAFKGYRGYPCTLCASVNEQVVHGIPSNRALGEGDVILRAELDELATRRGAEVHYVIGEPLSPERLLALVPDIAARDVYVCGSPAMTEATHASLARTGVSRRHIVTERFAF